jgi:hypothetical protein
MNWQKLGIVWKPNGVSPIAKTHAICPTPLLINENLIRVYVTCLDEKGRGRPFFVEVSAKDPTRVLNVGAGPCLDLGEPGTFDENGVMALSVVPVSSNKLYMYYAGFELCKSIRYRIFTGLAISEDGGLNFKRARRTPVLDRSDQELYFRGGPFALFDNGIFRLWYVGGSEWTDINGKSMPVYDLRYLESENGIDWGPRGKVCLSIEELKDEHGFGRPWLVKSDPSNYQLFYSIRKRTVAAYRLGYAESRDGINWIRKDQELNLDVSPGEFDSEAIMYSAILKNGDATYCFYNGNTFGEQGFAIAKLKI